MLDFDGVPLPDGMSVIVDPEACIYWVVDHLLPPEFKQADFVYQLSNSAGLTKPENQLHVHLWFFTDRPYWDVDLRAWANWWNSKRRNKIIDPIVFQSQQPHFTTNPELLDGLEDPFLGRRIDLVRRRRRTVRLYMPTVEEIAEEARLKRDRAKAARASHARAKQPSNREEDPSSATHEGEEASADGGDPNSENWSAASDDATADRLGSEHNGAVRDGPGWRGCLRMIGFEGHIRVQVRAAIGSYFYENGSSADRRAIRDAIDTAIRESPFLDCDAPWSRPRRDALDYLDAQGGLSNVDEMIRDIAALEKAREKTSEEVCDPTWCLPSLTLEEASDQLRAAVDELFRTALEFRQRSLRSQDGFIDEELLFSTPTPIAVLSDPGVGKTEAYIEAIIRLLRADPGVRVAIAVPTHALGKGLAERINNKFGSQVAAEWYGISHPDPQAPEHTMCRLADAALELQSSGGRSAVALLQSCARSLSSSSAPGRYSRLRLLAAAEKAEYPGLGGALSDAR
jgi:hypothetical protein